MNKNKRWAELARIIAITCLLSGMGAGSALAVGGSAVWNAGIDNWFTSTNWNPTVVPGSSTSVVIDNGGTAQISSGTARSYDAALGLTAGNSGSVAVTGAGTTWGVNTSITVGGGGTGSLAISNGGVVTDTEGYIGFDTSSDGSVTVDGAGSGWMNSGSLAVGGFGTGSLAISNGGVVTSTFGAVGLDTGSDGSVTVDGAGSSWINSGAFGVGVLGTSTGELIISNGGVVTNTGGFIGFEPGSNGSVTVDGTGSSWTNSDNLYIGLEGTGSLTISNGGSVDNFNGFIGYDLGSNGSVTVDGAGSTWAATNTTITVGSAGTGTLTISDGGTVTAPTITLGSDSGSVGTLNIGSGAGAGILDTPVVVTGSGSGTLNFNHSDAGYYFTNDGTSGGTDVIISGPTAVNHIGSGTTFLTGTHTYTGATTINNGVLFVNGDNSTSTTTVNAGGTLGGTGTVGSVIINGGSFAPGNSIGTINVTGNVDFSAGGTYQVEVDAAGNSDLINATGTATLTNGAVQVLPEAGTYGTSIGDTIDYTILTAAGGLGGTTFASNSIDSNFAFLTPTLSYDTNNVYLNLTRNSTTFNNIATTPNQVAIANILEQLNITDPTIIEELLNALVLLTASGAQQAYDNLSGVQHSISPGLSNQLMQRLFKLIQVYRGSHGWGKSFASLDNESGINSGDGYGKDIHWWIQGFAEDGDIDDSAQGTIADVDYRNNGLAIGADMSLNDRWTIGLAGSFTNSDINSGGSDADVDSYQLAAYANWQDSGWYTDLAFGYAEHDTDTDRTVTVGTLTGIANSDYDSDTIGASVEVGKRFTLGNGMNLTPFAGLAYTKTDREDFTETGSFANLIVDDETHESIRTSLGIRLSKTFKTDKGSEYTPSASIAYVHESGDKDNLMKAAFSAAPNSSFIVEGHDIDRDRLQLGLGVTGRISDNTQFRVGYDGEFAGSDDYHSLSATLRVRW